MKIISPFHDYYDSCLAYGHDDRVVYLRTPYEFNMRHNRTSSIPPIINDLHGKLEHMFDPKKNERYFINTDYTRPVPDVFTKKHKYTFEGVGVLFCGKYYPGVRCVQVSPSYADRTEEYFYTLEDVSTYLLTNCNYDVNVVRRHRWARGMVVDQLRAFFEAQHTLDINWLIEHKVTNIVVDWYYDVVKVNPKLSDYGFYKVLDPFSTYQELDMWVSGTLAYPQNMMVEVSDKDRIVQHGFDVKYGFRTRPKT